MKKLKLNKASFAGAEVLSREQLKNVMGGSNEEKTSACPDGQFPFTCTNNSGTVSGCASSIGEAYNAC